MKSWKNRAHPSLFSMARLTWRVHRLQEKPCLNVLKTTGNVIVDLSGVTYIDSSGVASLVEALQAAKKNGSQLSLAAVSEPTRRVLELARLDKVFTIYNSVDEALDNKA